MIKCNKIKMKWVVSNVKNKTKINKKKINKKKINKKKLIAKYSISLNNNIM